MCVREMKFGDNIVSAIPRGRSADVRPQEQKEVDAYGFCLFSTTTIAASLIEAFFFFLTHERGRDK
jgi:hypothetical protein